MYHLVARWFLVIGAQSNNITLLLLLKNDYGYDIYYCAYAMSFIGFVCGITSLISAKLVLILDLHYVVRYGALIMFTSCLLRAVAYDVIPILALSVVLDCICGTLYFPAFDAIFISSLPQKYIGRVMAMMDTMSLCVSIVIPLVMVDILHPISHRLPFWVGSICSFTSWCIHHGGGVRDGGCSPFGCCNQIRYDRPRVAFLQI